MPNSVPLCVFLSRYDFTALVVWDWDHCHAPCCNQMFSRLYLIGWRIKIVLSYFFIPIIPSILTRSPTPPAEMLK